MKVKYLNDGWLGSTRLNLLPRDEGLAAQISASANYVGHMEILEQTLKIDMLFTGSKLLMPLTNWPSPLCRDVEY